MSELPVILVIELISDDMVYDPSTLLPLRE